MIILLNDFISRIKSTKKYSLAILAVAIMACVILALLLDVWLLGSAAAVLHGVPEWLKGFSYFATDAQEEAAKHAFDGMNWYWRHPLATALAWLTKPAGQLSNPEVRIIWLLENLLLIFGSLAVALMFWQKKNKGNKDLNNDIRKIRFKRVNYNVEKETERTPAGQVLLGCDDRRQPVRIPWAEMTEHMHILGGSGTGKTSLMVVPICVQAIRAGLPVVVVDFKGDKQAIQLLAKEAKKTGKKFYLFSLHPDIKSNTYNPIESGNVLSKVERVLTALDLVYDGAAKFYTYSQQATFIPLLEYFINRDVICTLRDIWNILADAELMKEIIGQKIDAGHIKGLWAALTPYARLEQINKPKSDISLAGVLKKGDVVYFDLRSSVAPKLAAGLGKMIALDLQAQAAFRTQADRIALIAIDEFQTMACEAFRDIIQKFRSANYALVLANQALGDIRSVGMGFADTIGTNTKTKIIFSVDDPVDVESYIKKSGSIQVRMESESRSRSGRYAGNMGNITEGKSTHLEEKGMIHPNQLLMLPFGKTVMYRRGEMAKFLNHAHLISKADKDQLEQAPYPEPAMVKKQSRGALTAKQIIDDLKRQIVESGKQEQKNGEGHARQQPGKVENAGIELEDISM